MKGSQVGWVVIVWENAECGAATTAAQLVGIHTCPQMMSRLLLFGLNMEMEPPLDCKSLNGSNEKY